MVERYYIPLTLPEPFHRVMVSSVPPFLIPPRMRPEAVAAVVAEYGDACNDTVEPPPKECA